MFTARRRRIDMRKLNALLRSLHTFLADALVLVDNVVEAVAGFLRKDSEEQEPEPTPKS